MPYHLRCPKCGHSAHTVSGCLNPASDSDCDCTYDCSNRTTDEIPVTQDELAAGGTRADKGKPELHYIPTEVLVELAKLFMIGAEKYSPNNWKRGMDYSRMYNSMLRHAFKFWEGENIDPDGQHHLDSVIWNAVCLRYFELYPIMYHEFDNREAGARFKQELSKAAERLKIPSAQTEYVNKGLKMRGAIEHWAWPTRDKLVIEQLLRHAKGLYVSVLMESGVIHGQVTEIKNVSSSRMVVIGLGGNYYDVTLEQTQIEEIIEIRDSPEDLQSTCQ